MRILEGRLRSEVAARHEALLHQVCTAVHSMHIYPKPDSDPRSPHHQSTLNGTL